MRGSQEQAWWVLGETQQKIGVERTKGAFAGACRLVLSSDLTESRSKGGDFPTTSEHGPVYLPSNWSMVLCVPHSSQPTPLQPWTHVHTINYR